MPSSNMIFGGGSGGGLQIKSRQVFTGTISSGNTLSLSLDIATVNPDNCIVLISFVLTEAYYNKFKHASGYTLTSNNISVTFYNQNGTAGDYVVEIIEIENFKSIQRGQNADTMFQFSVSPVNYSKCLLMYTVHTRGQGSSGYGGNWSGLTVYIDEVNNKIIAKSTKSYSGQAYISSWNLIELN